MSGLEPLSCSLRVIGHVLQGLAEACNYRISRRLSLLRVAACCTVLRSRWCQSGIRKAGGWYLSDPPAPEIRKRSLGVPLQEAFCHGDGGVDGDLVASFLAATASSSARSFPLLCEPPVLECPLTFLHRTSL